MATYATVKKTSVNRPKDPDENVREVGSTPTVYGFDEVGKVSDDYCPEGYDDVELFLKDMRATYSLDVDADRENRDEAVEDKKFAAGEQWDATVLAQRAGLPCLVINTVPQFTAQLVGDWRQNQNGIKVVPAENGDVDTASIRGDLIRSIELKSKASRVYDSAFESMIQCGDGAYQIAVDYSGDDVFDQEILIKPIDDVLSTVWDRMSIDPTGADANHVFVDENYPRKEFDRLWPKADPSELSKDDQSELLAYGWCDSDVVRVTAYWRMIIRDRLLVMFQDGSMHAMDEATSHIKLDGLIEKHGPPIKSRIAPCRYAQMHLVTGFKILAGPFEYRLTRVPIIRMTGRVVNVKGRRIRHGLVRFMKDPVRLRNFWRSIAAEQLGYAPKAQWLATESAVEGREEDLRKAHLSRDPLIIVNDEAIFGQNIMKIDPPVPQSAILNEAAVNAQDMKDVTGIHDASLGIKSNETSGKAIMARQREGDVASLTYYDNGNAALLEGGDVINQLIGQIYDGTRTVRIIGEDESARLVRINDPMDPASPDLAVGHYDVAITTGASYTTRRVEAADAMMQAVQVWPQLIQVAGDLIAKAQDWPGADQLSERLRKTIPPQLLVGEKDPTTGQPTPAQPPVPDPQTQELIMKGHAQIQELSQQVQQQGSDKSVALAKLEVDKYNAETNRMKVLNDAMAKNHDARNSSLKTLSDMTGDSAPA